MLPICLLTVFILTAVWAKTWNHLLYLVGDNDLEYFAVKDSIEMLSMSSSDIRLTVFVDRASPGTRGDTTASLGGGVGNFVDGKILLLNNGDWVTRKSTSEPDMADPDTLRDFIRDYQPTGSEDTYQMLEFWNHGGSFVGFGHDESSDKMMSLQDIQDGVKDGLAQVSLSKFDIIGFDACLMANFAVFLALSPYTKYIVASEDVEPGFGWDYTKITSSSKLEDYGESIIDSFVAQGRQNPRTLGLYDMDFLTSDFKPLFDTMVTHLYNALVAKDEAILRALNAASFHAKRVDGGGIDLGEFLDKLESALPSDCKTGTYDFKVSELIAKYAPTSFAGGASSGDYLLKLNKNGESGDRHTGVTIFWPTSTNINVSPTRFDRHYLNLRDYGQGVWLKMIKHYHNLRNMDNPSMTLGYCQGSKLSTEISKFSTSKGRLTEYNNNLRISVTTSGEVGDSYSEWGVELSDGTVYVFSSNDGTLTSSTSSKNDLKFTWDRTAIWFNQDDNKALGFSYSFYDDATGEKEIYCPVIYYAESDVVPKSMGKYTGSGGYNATLYLKVKANGDKTVALYVAATKDDASAKAEVSRESDACVNGCGKILTKYYTNNIGTFHKNNQLNYGKLFDWKDVDVTRGQPKALSSGTVVCYIQVFAVYREMWTYQILRKIREENGALTSSYGLYRLEASPDSETEKSKSMTYVAVGAAGLVFLCCVAACFFFLGGDAAAACCSIASSLLGQLEEERDGMELNEYGEPKEMIRPGFV